VLLSKRYARQLCTTLPSRSDYYSKKIYAETSASVTTKGVWYPDKSKATEKDPPLYLHISATTQEILDKAIKRVNDLIASDLGPLVEDRRKEFTKERVSVRMGEPTEPHYSFRENGLKRRLLSA
jgi:hypothetical protein